MALPDNDQDHFKHENDNQNTTPAAGSSPQLVLPKFYQTRDFRDVKLKEMYGTEASKRDRKRFKKYLESEQGQQDWLNFEKAESDKYFASIDARQAALKKYADELMKPSAPTAAAPAPDVKPKAPAVKPASVSKAAQQAAIVNSQEQPFTPTQPVQPVQETPLLTVEDYKNSKYFRGVHGMSDGATLTIEGKQYPIFVIQNRYTGSGKAKEENDRTYAVDPETGKMRRVFENWLGMPYNAWSTDPGGEDWFYPSWMAGPEYEWKKANPMPSMRGPLGGGLTPEYKTWVEKYKAAKAAGFKKQGGTMNRINYFQQGGAAPQQDIQKQVVALVQAAMQGDQKATQTVNQIMEAAKAGDQQAAQIAQMIQDVVQQMQGQAASAKWGSKLNYIRSLKYAQGGKACPACQAGATIPQDKTYIKPNKKIEEKACGGKAKKMKKRYFGGWL